MLRREQTQTTGTGVALQRGESERETEREGGEKGRKEGKWKGREKKTKTKIYFQTKSSRRNVLSVYPDGREPMQY